MPVGKPVSILPQALLEPRRPLAAISIGWLTAFFPSLLLLAALRFLMPDAGQAPIAVDGARMLALVVLVAPALETLVMGLALIVLLSFLKPAHAIIVSAIGWGIAHSLVVPAWGLVIWWPFLVFSTLFVTWRRRSLLAALAISGSVHALQNSLPALFLLKAGGA